MRYLGAHGSRNQGQRFWNQFIQRGSAQTASHHQQFERPAPLGKAHGRIELPGKRRTQRVADPFGIFQHAGESGEDAVGDAGQQLVDQASHGILFVQDQRLAQQHAHHAGRKGDIAAQANHHIGLDAADDLHALPESLEQAQRQKGQGHRPLAAHARKIDAFEGKAARRHELAFHTGAASAAPAAQPVNTPAALAQGFRHGQTGENVTAGATSHDQSTALAAHTRPPRIKTRFS